MPCGDAVWKSGVKLNTKTRPNNKNAPDIIKKYISWGAGPRASQYLILGAKCNAILNGKYSPDIEDVQAVAESVLRHRLVKNYIAESEGYTIEKIIKEIL